MTDILFTPIRLSELEILITNSVEKALKNHTTSSKEKSEFEEEIFNIDEAAEFLNLKNPTIYSLVSRGELPVMKRSKRLYFSKLELINYLKQGRNKTNSEIESEAKHFLNRNSGRAAK